jgi:hypothetical protein
MDDFIRQACVAYGGVLIGISCSGYGGNTNGLLGIKDMRLIM